MGAVMEFATKDSGKRQEFASGMVRDVQDGKTDYTYCTQGPMLERWAQLMERGAKKYERDNWMKASGTAELDRFRASALRHMVQWLRGDADEDHAAAVIFNLNGAEYVKGKIAGTYGAPVMEFKNANLVPDLPLGSLADGRSIVWYHRMGFGGQGGQSDTHKVDNDIRKCAEFHKRHAGRGFSEIFWEYE